MQQASRYLVAPVMLVLQRMRCICTQRERVFDSSTAARQCLARINMCMAVCAACMAHHTHDRPLLPQKMLRDSGAIQVVLQAFTFGMPVLAACMPPCASLARVAVKLLAAMPAPVPVDVDLTAELWALMLQAAGRVRLLAGASTCTLSVSETWHNAWLIQSAQHAHLVHLEHFLAACVGPAILHMTPSCTSMSSRCVCLTTPFDKPE